MFAGSLESQPETSQRSEVVGCPCRGSCCFCVSEEKLDRVRSDGPRGVFVCFRAKNAPVMLPSAYKNNLVRDDEGDNVSGSAGLRLHPHLQHSIAALRAHFLDPGSPVADRCPGLTAAQGRSPDPAGSTDGGIFTSAKKALTQTKAPSTEGSLS